MTASLRSQLSTPSPWIPWACWTLLGRHLCKAARILGECHLIFVLLHALRVGLLQPGVCLVREQLGIQPLKPRPGFLGQHRRMCTGSHSISIIYCPIGDVSGWDGSLGAGTSLVQQNLHAILAAAWPTCKLSGLDLDVKSAWTLFEMASVTGHQQLALTCIPKPSPGSLLQQQHGSHVRCSSSCCAHIHADSECHILSWQQSKAAAGTKLTGVHAKGTSEVLCLVPLCHNCYLPDGP